MPEKIQRLPSGLIELLSISGGQTPRELEDRIGGVLELLQFYGLTQRQTLSLTAAANEGVLNTITPAPTSWAVLFAAHANFTKTATLTALRGEVYLNRTAGANVLLFSSELGPFGATETGTAAIGGYLHYPLLLPPGSTVSSMAPVIGTDANNNQSVTAEFGILG